MKIVITAFVTEQPSDNTISDIIELTFDNDTTPAERQQILESNADFRDLLGAVVKGDPRECTLIRIERDA